MTLEDFFTLTEMNNGLTAPSRVRELMAMMQKEKDYIVKNSADSTRQWSAVASAIAATENKECLDLFIQLDGLHFISEWLKDAQKFCNDSADDFVEKSISHLLRALKKLHVKYEKLVASEIWETIQDLLAHNSLKVRDEAQALCECWGMNRDHDAAKNVEKSRKSTKNEAAKSVDPESAVGKDSVSKETSEGKSLEMTGDDEMLSTNSDAVHTGQLESGQDSGKHLDFPITKKESDDRGSPALPRSSVEPPCHSDRGSPALPRSSVEPPCHSVGTAIEPCSPAVSKLDAIDAATDANDSKLLGYKKQSPKTENSPHKSGLVEESKRSEDRIISSNCDADDQRKPAVEASSLKASVVEEKGSFNERLSHIDTPDAKFTNDNNEFNCRMLRKASSCEKIQRNTKDLGTSGSKDDTATGQKIGGLVSIRNFGEKRMNKKPAQASNKTGSEIMDYGIFDPLEYARQVAIEVGREIVDGGEHSGGSSSEKLSENNMQQLDSTDCMNGKQSLNASVGSHEEEGSDPEMSAVSSPMQQDSASTPDSPDGEQANDTQYMANSQIKEAAQEEANLEKGPCGFDLNEEVLSEDGDHPGSQNLTPISTVAASRAAAAAPALPGPPLQFEGNLGWKGSAATSAFRRASPRRVLDSDKDPSAGRTSNNSKQPVCLDIDLNVGESIATREGGALLDKHVNMFPSMPSGEPSVEGNSRRSELLELDLNCAGEDGSTPDWRIQQFFPHGNYSNSSSSKQPARNINLNDRPSFLNDSSDNCHLSMASQNCVKSDDSVISIMGTRVEVNRKDFISPTPSLSNGLTSELSFDVNLGRTGGFLGTGSALPYSHSSIYGYNNITPAPAMPFSSPIYGSAGPFPTPYMVDSRGAPVIPQIVGSASALPMGFSPPPFVVNMNGFTPPNGIRPLHSGFDVNSGTFLESGSSKDPAGLGLFLNSTQVQSVDEQPRSHPQPNLSSVFSGKRKEPDNGWEHYPFKPYMPHWKHT